MIIATYNIWNDSETLFSRMDAICEEIRNVNADVIALQEVSAFTPGNESIPFAEYIAKQTDYPYVAFHAYPNPDDSDEGLAILSKYPIETKNAMWESDSNPLFDCAQRVTVQVDSFKVGITNVHLDWKSILNREVQMCAVIDWISEHTELQKVEILCGDFNDIPDSSIHRFLSGSQSLNGRAAKWLDLAAYHEWRTGLEAIPTLDFSRNPRWDGVHTLQIPARFDWIMLRQDPLYKDVEPIVKNVRVFGTEPTAIAKKVPSDHYGVVAELEFLK